MEEHERTLCFKFHTNVEECVEINISSDTFSAKISDMRFVKTFIGPKFYILKCVNHDYFCSLWLWNSLYDASPSISVLWVLFCCFLTEIVKFQQIQKKSLQVFVNFQKGMSFHKVCKKTYCFLENCSQMAKTLHDRRMEDKSQLCFISSETTCYKLLFYHKIILKCTAVLFWPNFKILT